MSRIKEATFILCAVTSIAIGIIIGTEINNADTIIAEVSVHTRYTQYGRYFTDGTLITENGHEWGYDTNTVSNITVYDDMPVWVAFDDNGTPDDIADDTILGMVYDRTTAVIDTLESELSVINNAIVIRDGNNIRLEMIQ